MITDDASLVLLKTCANQVEASAVRSLLEANGISCVVRGETHNAMLGVMGNGLIELGVLVAQKDLESARALLASEVAAAKTPLEEAICPVHGERATAQCSHCGTFLCARCALQGAGPPLCEDCTGRTDASLASHRRRRKLVAWGVALFVLLLVLLLGIPY